MEAKTRSQGLLLAGLLVVLALALWWNSGGVANEHATAAGSDRMRAAAQASRRGAPAPDAVVELIALDRLETPAPEPAAAGRNPFRFEAQRQPAPPDGGGRAGRRGVPDDEPNGPTANGPVQGGPPPIPLRFIGTVDELARHLKLAVLSDGRNVFYGREGDIIEGRYRILRIGVESIEMTYVDGRGQQTIRLTGS
ncbi:MAG TPA: hypothetical protein VE505_13255 [Vicinamibacterales bacterium]|nr:hypothetical protein [Vicinamibacterales bacterium]